MKHRSVSSTRPMLAGMGLLSMAPALYFVGGSILKYELHLLPNVIIHPIKPAILLGGLMFAIGLNIYPTIKLGLRMVEGAITFNLTLSTRSWNLAILLLSIVLFTVLIGYVVTENFLEMIEQSRNNPRGFP